MTDGAAKYNPTEKQVSYGVVLIHLVLCPGTMQCQTLPQSQNIFSH